MSLPSQPPTPPEVATVLMPISVDWFGLALNFIQKESHTDDLCLASLLIIHVAGEAAVCSFSLLGLFRHRTPHDSWMCALHQGATGVVESELSLEPGRLRSRRLSLVSSDPQRATSPEAWVPHLQNGVMCLCVRTGRMGVRPWRVVRIQ